MLSANISVSNGRAGSQYQSLLQRLLFSTGTTVPCCIFLFINLTMLFTLRSKAVFRDSSCYVLLFNLLFADTVQMMLFVLATCRMRLTYPVCGALHMLTNLFNEASPYTLLVMSLERYTAVCHPLRHATVITIGNTTWAIVVVWAITSLNVIVRVLLLLDLPFEDLDTLQMIDYCSNVAMVLGPLSDVYDKAYTILLFVSATVAITSSYIGVMVAARSASTDKASAHKAWTVYKPILIRFSRIVNRLVFVRLQHMFYICIFIFPTCLSSLIYGIRDETITRSHVLSLLSVQSCSSQSSGHRLGKRRASALTLFHESTAAEAHGSTNTTPASVCLT